MWLHGRDLNQTLGVWVRSAGGTSQGDFLHQACLIERNLGVAECDQVPPRPPCNNGADKALFHFISMTLNVDENLNRGLDMSMSCLES